MQASERILLVAKVLMLIAFVVSASFIVTSVWVQKKEEIPDTMKLTYQTGMTISEFGNANRLSNHVLKETFKLSSNEELLKKIDQFQYTEAQLTERIDKAQALEAEHESKDWRKILLKFGLWFAFMGLSFYLIRKNRLTPGMRKVLYISALVIFGVLLGADPSPMGTVKDAIALFAVKQVVFPPRLIALTVFLLTVFLANKFICSWGCQVGTLQDLIFRFNRNKKDNKGLLPQFKLPFVISNGFRAGFFLVFTAVAFIWATDIYEEIDPFKIYKPAVVSTFGWGFLAMLVIVSLFIYRPWCSLFCPFGLLGWAVEKLAVFKITVNYATCTACESCVKACPTTVMGAILKQDKVVPDCFSCGVCLDTCPTGSISFSAGKREKPPADQFIGNNIAAKN